MKRKFHVRFWIGGWGGDSPADHTYYEQADSTQPAEEFEGSLKRHHKKLGVKLRAIATAIEVYGPQLGGGLIEPCHDHKGLWEIRTIFNGFLGRELFGFDGERHRVVLLHG